MVKKIKVLNTKFELRPKHVEIILIIITLLMGIVVVYLYKNKIEKEIIEKYQNKKNNKNNNTLLLFYAPWCGASKAFLPIWERLTGELKTETYNVDLEENKEISNQFNIEYLPTLFLINGSSRLKYDGDRSYEDIMTFFNNN